MEPNEGHGNARALELAQDACEKNFSSRRGLYLDAQTGAICVYNNNPYKDPAQREGEIAAFRQWLRDNGKRELGAAYYPPKTAVEDAGYTFAMLIEGEEEDIEPMKEALERITSASFKVMDAATRN